jgi:hypothetical protein
MDVWGGLEDGARVAADEGFLRGGEIEDSEGFAVVIWRDGLHILK